MQDIPLAERLRPKRLADVIGQTHLLADGAALRKCIDQGHLPSMILCGPPGVGKTTIAHLLAEAVDRPLVTLSAITSGVKDIREITLTGGDLLPPVVFIDEIHRFNKTQQDALLPAVEKGKITLIGATTENASFSINNALLSRCQVYTLKSLTDEALIQLYQRACSQDLALKNTAITLQDTNALLQCAAGDGRKLLNILEMCYRSHENPDSPLVITDVLVSAMAQRAVAHYDKSGDQHYDIVSAMIKSIRGSDPDAALYWMARMIVGGEDPVFIARRLVIAASEDIGMANPNALLLAGECLRSVQAIGHPECRIILGQVVVYLATSPKSNSSYMAINAAMAAAEKSPHFAVPLHLRNAPSALMQAQGHGVGYLYPHNYPHNYIKQAYLPEPLSDSSFYQPQHNQAEVKIQQHLQQLRSRAETTPAAPK